MQASRIRRAYLEFYRQRGHAAIARANLVPREDPTTLLVRADREMYRRKSARHRAAEASGQ